MEDEYFCTDCNYTQKGPGLCKQCGRSLETIGDAAKENGDIIDDELLGEIHNIPATQEAGTGKIGDGFEDDY